MTLIALNETRRVFPAGLRVFITPLRCLFTDAGNGLLFVCCNVDVSNSYSLHFIFTAADVLQTLLV